MARRSPRLDEQQCSIARALAVIGERWTLLVVRDMFAGLHRFDDIQQSLGIARNILTDRLTGLTEIGIVKRVPYQDRPVRYEYHLTRKGIDLRPILVGLQLWGDRYSPAPEGPLRRIVHTACEHSTQPRLRCSHCSEAIANDEIQTPLRRRGTTRRAPKQPARSKR